MSFSVLLYSIFLSHLICSALAYLSSLFPPSTLPKQVFALAISSASAAFPLVAIEPLPSLSSRLCLLTAASFATLAILQGGGPPGRAVLEPGCECGLEVSPAGYSSQRHPEQLPEVTGTNRGNTGYPAATRERPRESFFNAS